MVLALNQLRIHILALPWILNGHGPYEARSASDKTDNWPYWYVCGPDGRKNLLTLPREHRCFGAVFTSREEAERIAKIGNQE